MITHTLALGHLLTWCKLEAAAWNLRLTHEDRPHTMLEARLVASTLLGEAGLRACRPAH